MGKYFVKKEDYKSKQILIAEDDPFINTMLQRLLKIWGYRTLSACTGRQAMKVAERHEGEIDLLLSDITMPEMGGQELAEKLTAKRPLLKVILTTGYSKAQIVVRKGWKVVQKPFKAQTIMQEIEDSLKPPPSEQV
jgi:two-component system cell cycle sensor histidine kinase/response regulator CckA